MGKKERKKITERKRNYSEERGAYRDYRENIEGGMSYFAGMLWEVECSNNNFIIISPEGNRYNCELLADMEEGREVNEAWDLYRLIFADRIHFNGMCRKRVFKK